MRNPTAKSTVKAVANELQKRARTLRNIQKSLPGEPLYPTYFGGYIEALESGQETLLKMLEERDGKK